ncbi:MAG: pyrroloquinoline quinone precursor peptide PqqA [Planctomycetaceae bacterium]|nr:pyrroloquinoline quinone precursor peptide PqqA [Planctomycetaceae bacterium]
MEWTKPNFVEMSLSGEVTAYANTDSTVRPATDPSERPRPRTDRQTSE